MTPDEVSTLKDHCSSFSFSIAPIPTSVIALESSFNATYTGTFPATGNTNGGGTTPTTTAVGTLSGTQSATTAGSETTIAGSTNSKKASKDVLSTSMHTLDGGAAPTITTAVIKPTTSTGAGVSKEAGEHILWSAFLLGVTTLFAA